MSLELSGDQPHDVVLGHPTSLHRWCVGIDRRSHGMGCAAARDLQCSIYGINGSGMHTHQSLYSIAESRNAEWDEYRNQVSDWEVDRYLEMF